MGINALIRAAHLGAFGQRDSEDAAKAIEAETKALGHLPVDELPPGLLPGRYYDIGADEFVTYDGVNVTPELLRMVRVGSYSRCADA